MNLDTGPRRSVTGNAISGGIIGALVAGAYHYSKVKNKEENVRQAVMGATLRTAQMALFTGSAIAAANALGDKKKGAVTSIVEAGGIIAISAVANYFIAKEVNAFIKNNASKTITLRTEDSPVSCVTDGTDGCCTSKEGGSNG